MTELRKTRLSTRVGLTAVLVGLLGCGTPVPPGPPPSPHALGSNDPAWIAHRGALPTPKLDDLYYEKGTRTLRLYNLSGNDRWEVQLPGEKVGTPVAARHKIPDVDLAQVRVYYTRPGARPSFSVSVKQIQENGGVHVSLR